MTSSTLIFLCQLLKVDLPDYEWDRARTRGDIPPEKVKFIGLDLNIGHRLQRSWLLSYKHQAIIMMVSDSWKDEKGWLKSYVKRAASNVYIKFWSCLGQICSPWGWWQGNLLPYEWWYNDFQRSLTQASKVSRDGMSQLLEGGKGWVRLYFAELYFHISISTDKDKECSEEDPKVWRWLQTRRLGGRSRKCVQSCPWGSHRERRGQNAQSE